MSEKLHLTRVYRSEKDKNGQPLVGRNGKAYSKIAIKTVEYGDKWVNGFGNRDNERWNEGDEVIARVVKNGEYLNLERVSELEQVMEKLDEILKYVRTAKQPERDFLTGEVVKSYRSGDTEPEIRDEDIPF